MKRNYYCHSYYGYYYSFIIMIMWMAVAAAFNDKTDPVNISNHNEMTKQVIICEGKHANISCTEGRFIAIRLANYGRFTITQCNPTFNTELSTTCQNDKTLGILQLECNGKSECDFEVSNEYFGDACPKTSKYLDMQYDCTLTAVAAPTTKGSIMDENGLPDASVRELPNGDDLSDARDSDINGNDATYHAHAISVPNDLDSKSSEQHLTAHCEAISSRYIDWPKTEVGKLARMGCPIGSSGYAEWKCELDGKWNKRGADLSRCVSSWSLRISEDAELAEDIVDRIETLREIQQMTRKEELLGGDLIVLSKAINQSIPLNFDDSANADLSMELVVESVNNMAKTSQESAWNDLSIMKSRRVISSLMDNINKIACAVSVLTTSDTTRTIIKPNIEVQISNVKIHEYVTFPSMSLYKKNLDTIDVPKEALSLRNTVNVYAKVVYSMYSAMASHMKPLLLLPNGNRTNNPELNQKLNKNSVNNNGGNDNNNNNAVIIDRLIVSNIISASIINKNNRIQSISRLSKPVVLTFKTKSFNDPDENKKAKNNNNSKTNKTSLTCVWWDNKNYEWSSRGCEMNSHNETHTICYCDHLTHFAVIMNIYDQQLSDGHLVALTFITYSGCTLSILCLLLSFIAFSCIASQSGTDRLIIHANLSLSLLCAECIFLFGIWQTQNKIQCGIIAALLHYLFLCAFSWMLLEGFELYYMLIEVFQSRRSKKHYFYLFGYGCPALVVSIALWMDPYSYGTERYCWLRADNYFIVSFIAPVLVILICNCAFFIMTLCIVCRHSNIGYRTCKQNTENNLNNISSWLRGSIALVFLLGLTWTFGLLWIDERSTVMAYAFTILNSLQGLFIFLFHVVFNDRMRKDWKKWAKRRASSLPDCIREQTSTSATSSNLQRSSPYTRTQQQALNSNSSNTAVTSELLYPSLTTHKPYHPQCMVTALDRRYSSCVQVLVNRSELVSNGLYDYATIAYDQMCDQSANNDNKINYHSLLPATQNTMNSAANMNVLYLPTDQSNFLVSSSLSLANRFDQDCYHHPPPSFAPPEPPPRLPSTSSSSSSCCCYGCCSQCRLSSSPNECAVSGSHRSPSLFNHHLISLPYNSYSSSLSSSHPPSSSTAASSILLRMDLSKNPPVFVQGI